MEKVVKNFIKRYYYSSCLSTLLISSDLMGGKDGDKHLDCTLIDRAALGNVDAVKSIKIGSDDFRGKTIMYIAAAGYSQLLEMVLDSSAMFKKDIFGWTSLMYASRGGNMKCINVIVGKADSATRAKSLISQKNNLGEDAISIAKSYGHDECCVELTKVLG